MPRDRKLFTRVEKLLLKLLDEADNVTPAVVDQEGNELHPARPGATFGERLKLAEVATAFETRRAKVEQEDPPPSEAEEMLQEFHGNANRTSPRGAGRKKRAETDGLANAGRTLGDYQRNGSAVGGEERAE
jgi:hypothetical protein